MTAESPCSLLELPQLTVHSSITQHLWIKLRAIMLLSSCGSGKGKPTDFPLCLLVCRIRTYMQWADRISTATAWGQRYPRGKWLKHPLGMPRRWNSPLRKLWKRCAIRALIRSRQMRHRMVRTVSQARNLRVVAKTYNRHSNTKARESQTRDLMWISTQRLILHLAQGRNRYHQQTHIPLCLLRRISRYILSTREAVSEQAGHKLLIIHQSRVTFRVLYEQVHKGWAMIGVLAAMHPVVA
jgi:hypothetical protein